MSEMGSHEPFGHLKHKLWPKEGLGVKLTIWFPITESQESTLFPCVQVACNIPLKTSWQRLQLFLRPHFNRRSTCKVMGPKVARVPILPNGSPGTKCHLDVGFVKRHRIYYKGEDGSFPQVRAMVNLVSPSCPWLVLASKVFQLCTNHLVFNLCKSMWVIDACHSS
jgi:hypothetical protein